MFDWVHNNKRIIQVILALVIIPFAFWGVNFYEKAFVGGDTVAEVDGSKITEQEFSESLRQQQDRMRSMLGRNYDPSMLDSPEIRLNILEGMISQRLLAQYAIRRNMGVSDDQLRDTILSIPAFQENGKFSKSRYETALSAERFSPPAFESMLRRDMVLQQLVGAVSDSGIASLAVARRVAAARMQQREVSEQSITAASLAAEVKVAPEAVRAYYDGNASRFQMPERIKVEYVVLDGEALLATEQVSAEDTKAYYDANAAKFVEAEQRRASHILIAFKGGAGVDEKNKARAKAEQLLSQVKKSPGNFAEIAKKNSDDPGSAAKGGDLDFFARGMMVGPFEDAAFRLKPNEISGLVESDFGFHIIRLTGIKPGKTRSLAEARPGIESELKKQRAAKRFAEAAESFSNIVYEQSDSLQPAAERFKIQIRKADDVTRQGASVAELNNPKVLTALFRDDSLKNRHNTETVEVAPNTLVSARIVDYKPGAQRPFDEVKGEIQKQLLQQEALSLAKKRGAERVEQAGKSTAPAGFGAAKLVSRASPQGFSPEALAKIFGADVSKLPAYVGIETKDGYTVYRIGRVVEVQPDEAFQRNVQTELGRANGSEEFQAFLAGLRASGKIEINKALLEKKSN